MERTGFALESSRRFVGDSSSKGRKRVSFTWRVFGTIQRLTSIVPTPTAPATGITDEGAKITWGFHPRLYEARLQSAEQVRSC